MNHITEEKFIFLKEYLNTVNVVEVGFSYILSSFNDFNKTEGDRVFSDIIQALTIIAHSNALLEQILQDDTSTQLIMKSFNNVTEALFRLDGYFDDYNMKIIKELLYPAFSDWKYIVHSTIGKYVIT